MTSRMSTIGHGFRRRRLALTGGAAVAVLALGIPLAPAAGAAESPNPAHPASEVNTFIGTSGDGNTYPGAAAPFGMTQVSPSTGYFAGYRYGDTKITGFGTQYISGAGCWEQGGTLQVLPTTGTVAAGGDFDTAQPGDFDLTHYAASYDHDGEVGTAGYYRTKLTSYGGIDVEATATTRVGVERFTFPATTNANIFLNTGQAGSGQGLMKVAYSGVSIDQSTGIVSGEIRAQGFCSGADLTYSVYFAAKADAPITSFGTWNSIGGYPGVAAQPNNKGQRGAWLSFDTTKDRSVQLSTAISYTSVDGAIKNLQGEGMAKNGSLRDFDSVRKATEADWNSQLRRIDVTGGTADRRTTFYTALYHALLAPNTATDVDGAYRGFDDKNHVAKGWTYYQYLSLWDTFRTQNQLLAAFYPERAKGVGQTIMTIAAQGGWLPKWAYANYETNCMTGDSVSATLADLWRFGAMDSADDAVVLPGADTLSGKSTPLDVSTAYADLLQNVDGVPPADSQFQGRGGNENYIAKGWVDHSQPAKKGYEDDRYFAGSTTMEYAVADCAVSSLARAVGDTASADRLSKRSANWKNVWDPTLTDADHGLTGFPRARRADGSWSTAGITSAGDSVGFEEGTPWQYQWLAWQDFSGLSQAMGGDQATAARLDTFFDLPDLLTNPAITARDKWVVGSLAYDNAFRYNPNNEPDLHAPWLYNFLGEPAKSSLVARAGLSLFANSPDGITGNDDLGTMSSWYVLASLGLYPGVAGSGDLLLSAPAFAKARITLPSHKTITITAPGADGATSQYIAGLTIDGRDWPANHVSWDRLGGGAKLDYTLTDDISTTWGTSPSARPVAPCSSVDTPARAIAIQPFQGLTADQGKAADLDVATVWGDPGADPATFTAQIAWQGENKPTAAEVVYQDGELHVLQQHAFAGSGTLTGTLTVTSKADQQASGQLSVQVKAGEPAPPTPAVTPTPAGGSTPGDHQAGADGRRLPLTGTDPLGWIGAGAALALIGGLIAWTTRRRRQHD